MISKARQLRVFTEKNSQLESAIREKQEENAKLKSTNDELSEKVGHMTELNMQMGTLSREKEVLETAKTQYEMQIRGLEEERNKLQANISRTKAEMEQLITNLQTSENKVAELNSKISEQLLSHQEAVKKMDAEKQNERSVELQRLNQELVALREVNQHLSKQGIENAEKIETLSIDLEELLREKTGLALINTEQMEEITQLKDEIQGLLSIRIPHNESNENAKMLQQIERDIQQELENIRIEHGIDTSKT